MKSEMHILRFYAVLSLMDDIHAQQVYEIQPMSVIDDVDI